MVDSGEATYQIARSIVPIATLAIGLALEHWRPHARLRPAWLTNLGLGAIGALVMSVVCAACGWLVAEWVARHGVGVLHWVTCPQVLAVALGIAALDAVSYAWHRANHRLALLWRFHQVHHADASFHVTTALRFHPGELLLAVPVRLAAIVTLGIPPEGVIAFEVVFGAANVLEHGNFDLPRRVDRVLQRLLVTPSMHRRHHISQWRELDTNFGTIFSCWDRLAGTFRVGDPANSIRTGLPNWSHSGIPSLGGFLFLPFARGRVRG